MTDAKANALPARPWNSSTVSISDLDSLEQAMAWRRLGPQAALHSFVMMLRMALLSADYVYIDRNQLLEGVCLLALRAPKNVLSGRIFNAVRLSAKALFLRHALSLNVICQPVIRRLRDIVGLHCCSKG